jgi:hypothetical protein
VALVVVGLGQVARLTLTGLLRRMERRRPQVEEDSSLGVEAGPTER